MWRLAGLLLVGLAAGPATTRASPLLLNEYNAVSSSNYLNGGTEETDDDGGAAADPAFGRVLGNGGDWFELVVIADHLDIRGWKFRIYLLGDPTPDTILLLTNDPLWSDLRAGTIITVSEDVAEDASYDPGSGDWWINVRATDPGFGGTGIYITADSFPVNNDNWRLEIVDSLDQVMAPPTGEGTAPAAGVSSTELFRLEADPSVLIAPDSPQYDDDTTSSFGTENTFGIVTQDFSALRLGLPLPDSDADGIADDGDASGFVGDSPCTGGAVAGCDDNCPVANSLQQDTGGINADPPDGIGDVCQCGDVDDDGAVTVDDWDRLREFLVDDLSGGFVAEKCGVVNDGACTIADASVVRRATSGFEPPILPLCTGQ